MLLFSNYYQYNDHIYHFTPGDSGYPIRPWLMTPLLNPATRPERAFNRAHKGTRSIVERCIGLLKARFRLVMILCTLNNGSNVRCHTGVSTARQEFCNSALLLFRAVLYCHVLTCTICALLIKSHCPMTLKNSCRRRGKTRKRRCWISHGMLVLVSGNVLLNRHSLNNH